jgi:hypothetical protein
MISMKNIRPRLSCYRKTLAEAGQVSPEIGTPSFALAKKALVVGDPFQIVVGPARKGTGSSGSPAMAFYISGGFRFAKLGNSFCNFGYFYYATNR